MAYSDLARLNYPVVSWSATHFNRLRSPKQMIANDRSVFEDWKRLKNRGRILDSSGMKHSIVDVVDLNEGGRFSHLLFGYKVIPILGVKVQLSLEDFKSEIRKGIAMRERGDYDSWIGVDTEERLPSATTYREAIESLPWQVGP